MKTFALAAVALLAAATSSLAAQDPNLQDRPSLWQDAAVNEVPSDRRFGIQSTGPAGSPTAQTAAGQQADGGGSDYYR